ncbi:MAG: AIG2 family [Beijerinckiaceae bacterium]|nr:MAG: AIG2 family [Beijerinckiaceae bacterium]
MPLYFAYGANMDIADMAKRAPNSKPLGLARLPRHRFIIMAEGYASVVRDPRAAVHGLLWDLALTDLRPLDKFEGIDRGLYTKINQPVILEASPAKVASGFAPGDASLSKSATGAKRALVYVAASAVPGKPRPGYLEAILTAAAEIGLPPAYRKELAGWSAAPVAGPVAGVTPRAGRPGGAAERATDKWNWDG